MHSITVRIDTTTFSEIKATAKARGLNASEIVRQRLRSESNEQNNLLALIVSEIDDQWQQINDQKSTLAAILSMLENLSVTTPPHRAERVTQPLRAEPQQPAPQQPAAPQKSGTGEQWATWIVRQPFADADNGSPSARGRRVWRKFEVETGNEAPQQFRVPPHADNA